MNAAHTPEILNQVIDARDNYWATQSESEISARILDSDDDLSRLGEVTFLPILQSPHHLTP